MTKDTDDGNIMYSVQNLSLTSPSILSRTFGCISSDEAAIAEKIYISAMVLFLLLGKKKNLLKSIKLFLKTF